MPVVDVRRGEVAWAISGGPARLGSPAALAGELAVLGRPALLVGDGARRYGDELSSLLRVCGGPVPVLGGDLFAAPPVAALVELARRRLAEGGGVEPAALVPCYLRAADARINWSTRP